MRNTFKRFLINILYVSYHPEPSLKITTQTVNMETTAVRPDTLSIRPILKHTTNESTIKLHSPSSITSRSGHTCGSLFAKCNCKTTQLDQHSSAKTAEQHQLAERRRTLFQSYSHPDTNFVFTDENRNPTLRTRTPRGQSTTTRTKRLSTPCIPGTYSVLNMAVHPEVVLTKSHTNGRIEPMYAENGVTGHRPALKKSITFQGDVSALLSRMKADDENNKQNRSVSASSQEDFDSDTDSIISQPIRREDNSNLRSVDIDRVNQQYRDRCNSERSTTPSSPVGLEFGRKPSNSLGDGRRVDQVRDKLIPTIILKTNSNIKNI